MSNEALQARDLRLRAVAWITTSVAAVSVAAASGLYVGMQFPAKAVTAEPSVVNVAPPVVNVTVTAPTVSASKTPSATLAVKKVVAAPKAVSQPKKKAVTTSGGS